MALHVVPFGEPHDLALDCGCRPVAGWRVVKRQAVPVVEHRSGWQRWSGPQTTARRDHAPAEPAEPVEEGESGA